jgi:glutamine cyclotransferase
MKDKYIHILSIVLVTIAFGFVVFLYTTEPRTLAEVTTRGQVVLGTYAIDQTLFDQGLANFKRDEFIAARSAFDRADPERRDAKTQFYIAYSYYRQGWGLVTNDDDLFKAGVEATDRSIAADPNFRSTDQSLGLRSPAELKNELEEGLKITASDFNPMRLTRERK